MPEPEVVPEVVPVSVPVSALAADLAARHYSDVVAKIPPVAAVVDVAPFGAALALAALALSQLSALALPS